MDYVNDFTEFSQQKNTTKQTEVKDKKNQIFPELSQHNDDFPEFSQKKNTKEETEVKQKKSQLNFVL